MISLLARISRSPGRGGAVGEDIPAGKGPEPESFGIACVCADKSTMPLIEVIDGVAEMWTCRCNRGSADRTRRMFEGRRTVAIMPSAGGFSE